ncbi:MAG TPA: cation-transporting P-type ATPase [Candidatus Paceibacterota bacterium]|nr:cation-transporting P-type ATPase [Candidatus Paceibacterota bacterium]
MAEIFWHNLNFKEAAEILKTDIENGLSEKEARNRQKKFGKNKLPEEKPLSGFKIFLEQFYNPLVYILIIAGTICLIFKRIHRCPCYFCCCFFRYHCWLYSRK